MKVLAIGICVLIEEVSDGLRLVVAHGTLKWRPSNVVHRVELRPLCEQQFQDVETPLLSHHTPHTSDGTKGRARAREVKRGDTDASRGEVDGLHLGLVLDGGPRATVEEDVRCLEVVGEGRRVHRGESLLACDAVDVESALLEQLSQARQIVGVDRPHKTVGHSPPPLSLRPLFLADLCFGF